MTKSYLIPDTKETAHFRCLYFSIRSTKFIPIYTPDVVQTLKLSNVRVGFKLNLRMSNPKNSVLSELSQP